MIDLVRTKGHLSLIPGGVKTIVDRRAIRANKRYERLTRRVFNERGEVVFLPAIPSGDGAA